jgi:hypothetical protein
MEHRTASITANAPSTARFDLACEPRRATTNASRPMAHHRLHRQRCRRASGRAALVKRLPGCIFSRHRNSSPDCNATTWRLCSTDSPSDSADRPMGRPLERSVVEGPLKRSPSLARTSRVRPTRVSASCAFHLIQGRVTRTLEQLVEGLSIGVVTTLSSATVTPRYYEFIFAGTGHQERELSRESGAHNRSSGREADAGRNQATNEEFGPGACPIRAC